MTAQKVSIGSARPLAKIKQEHHLQMKIARKPRSAQRGIVFPRKSNTTTNVMTARHIPKQTAGTHQAPALATLRAHRQHVPV